MHFCLVTPCREVDSHLLRTIESIASQTVLASGKHRLTYIVQYKGQTAPDLPINPVPNLNLQCFAALDRGLYDALALGFCHAENADVFAYLGAGDWLSDGALEIVAEVMEDGVDWVTGMICGYNDRGHMVEALLPFRYRPRLIELGAYGHWLPYLQQESTFWSRRMHRALDWGQLRQMELAGDAMMWRTFAEFASPVVVEAWLGGFERRQGQLSVVGADRYREELRAISGRATLIDCLRILLDRVLWSAPRSVKRYFDDSRYVYDSSSRRYVSGMKLNRPR